MQDQDIINLWKVQNERLTQTMALNLQLLTEVKLQKVRSVLRSLSAAKLLGIVVGVIYLMLLGAILAFAIAHYSPAVNYFIGSFGVIFIINIKALADYIKHLVWINNIDYEGSVVDIQQKLSRLQLSIINHTRVVILQLPFWTTFQLSSNWFPQNVGWPYLVFQFTLTGLFTWLAYWLYKNLIAANANKKWFRFLLSGSGNKAVSKALQYYNEIESFKND